MTREEVHETVKALLITNFNIPGDKITPGAQFRANLGMDSLDIVDFVFFLRQKFGVSDDLDDYRDLHTMEKLCDFIVSRTGAE